MKGLGFVVVWMGVFWGDEEEIGCGYERECRA